MSIHFHPLGLAIVFFLGAGILLSPRKLALIPILLSGILLTMGQKVALFSFDLYPARIMIFFTIIRIIVRKEYLGFKISRIDKAILLLGIVKVVSRTLLYGNINAFLSAMGPAYTLLGVYFCLRIIIFGLSAYEVKMNLCIIGLFLLPLGLFMVREYFTGINVYENFGGVVRQLKRGGHFRAQGPFRHPILAGCFGAGMAPLYLALAVKGKNQIRFLALIGMAGSLLIVLSSQTSGGLLAGITGILSMGLLRYRSHLKWFRRGAVIFLIMAHFFMKAPVWYLMAKVSNVVGGSGYHRAALITEAINHFDEWALLGATETGHWLPYATRMYPTMVDITNQFLFEGVEGGLLGMVLFILVIVFSFKEIGNLLVRDKEAQGGHQLFIWSLGCALTTHIVAFFNVTYYDQIMIFFYFLVAIIATGGALFNKDSSLKNLNARAA